MSHNSEMEIERVVMEVLRENGVKTLPVDVHAIASNSGIAVLEKNVGGEGVSGMLISHANQYVIAYNSAIKNSGFQRFCIGHELGHYFLPGHIDALLGDGVPIHKSGISYDGYEKSADSFSARLLMPKPLVGKRLKNAELRISVVEQLAEQCDVSLEAAALRVMDLTSEAVAVARVQDGVIEYCRMSTSFKQIKGLTWIRGGSKAPVSSHTAELSIDEGFVTTGGQFEGDSCLSTWFSADYERPLKESVIGLGEYGKCLVLLQCDEEDEQEAIEDMEERRAEGVKW